MPAVRHVLPKTVSRSPVVSLLVALVAVAVAAACVSTGDKTITGTQTGQGSLCNVYCSQSQSAGCTVSTTCAVDCANSIPTHCSAAADNYYSCATSYKITCSASGAPVVSDQCNEVAQEYAACGAAADAGMEAGEAGPSCATATDCPTCCQTANSSAFTVYYADESSCVCQSTVCNTAAACGTYCADMSTTRSAACRNCWNTALATNGMCANQVYAACESNPRCKPLLDCVATCP
jgi:hypothetical protein